MEVRDAKQGWGVITAQLDDPLSLLTERLLGPSPFTAVGWYYYTESETRISLYSRYDRYPISWLPLGATISHLQQSPFCSRFTLFPLQVTINRFRQLVVEVLTWNEIESDNTTGLSLVNRLLLGAMGRGEEGPPSQLPLPCPLVGPGQLYQAEAEEPTPVQLRQLLESGGPSLLRLLQRQGVLLPLSPLYQAQRDLLTVVQTGLEGGSFSLLQFNTALRKLQREWTLRGWEASLPAPKEVSSSVQVVNWEVTPSPGGDPLRELGESLHRLLESPVVNLGTLIGQYNRLLPEVPIELPEQPTVTVGAVLVRPGRLLCPGPRPIPLYSPDLSHFSKEELLDLLLYLDSLPYQEGRYRNLQNEVTQALARQR